LYIPHNFTYTPLFSFCPETEAELLNSKKRICFSSVACPTGDPESTASETELTKRKASADDVIEQQRVSS